MPNNNYRNPKYSKIIFSKLTKSLCFVETNHDTFSFPLFFRICFFFLFCFCSWLFFFSMTYRDVVCKIMFFFLLSFMNMVQTCSQRTCCLRDFHAALYEGINVIAYEYVLLQRDHSVTARTPTLLAKVKELIARKLFYSIAFWLPKLTVVLKN